MNFVILLTHQAYALSYVPLANQNTRPLELPSFPNLASIESLLLIILFMFLVRLLLREQKDEKLETERVRTLKISALVGALVIVIRLYRHLSGN